MSSERSSTEPSTEPHAGPHAGPAAGPAAGSAAGPAAGPAAGRSAAPAGFLGRVRSRLPWQDAAVVVLQGGLGNQLFQWALGTELVARGQPVVYDRARLRGDRPLAIGPLLAGEPQVPKPLGLGLAALDRVGQLDRVPGLSTVRQDGFGFDPRALRARSGAYLLGFWQSPRFFPSVPGEVRRRVREFATAALTPAGRALLDRLQADPGSIAVHVRRGDYVANARARGFHGVLGVDDYYGPALTLLADRGYGRRYLFSDDLEWAAAHLARPDDVVVGRDVATAAVGEVGLMAACGARAIANSTFSWWAGWLADDRPDSTTVAPHRWFVAPGQDAGDLLPDGWLRC
jgi:hypothetical protein